MGAMSHLGLFRGYRQNSPIILGSSYLSMSLSTFGFRGSMSNSRLSLSLLLVFMIPSPISCGQEYIDSLHLVSAVSFQAKIALSLRSSSYMSLNSFGPVASQFMQRTVAYRLDPLRDIYPVWILPVPPQNGQGNMSTMSHLLIVIEPKRIYERLHVIVRHDLIVLNDGHESRRMSRRLYQLADDDLEEDLT